jgi:hypothetical protein
MQEQLDDLLAQSGASLGIFISDDFEPEPGAPGRPA